MVKSMDLLKSEDKVLWRSHRGLIQLFILCLLWVWAFWPHLTRNVQISLGSSENAHLLVVPVGVFFLIYLRRKYFIDFAPKDSLWGVGLLLLGLFMYSIFIWPITFLYAREMTTVIVLAALVLTTCGWRYFLHSIPILLFIMTAIPLGSGIFTRLVILPETYTIAACAKTLELLPDVQIDLKGIDLFFTYDGFSSVIGLGESYRGARLFQPLIALGVFIFFSKPRTLWRLFFVLICTAPILLFCNYLRLLCWSLICVYGKLGVMSTWPRFISTAIYLLIAYGLWVLACNIKMNLFLETDEERPTHEI